MTYPVLKFYMETPQVGIVQAALNRITKAWDPAKPYVPSAKAMSKMGREHYMKLEKAGFLLDPDNKYGRLTKARVVVYQDREGLSMIDGIVGPDETWPALAGTLLKIKKATIEKVLKDRPNLSSAKQLSTEDGLMSHDCGYFAGMAVAKTVKSFGGATSITFDRKDALAGRDAFNPSIPSDEQGKERSAGALHEFDAADYLKSLGADGFSRKMMTEFDYTTNKETVAFFDKHMKNGSSPVMVGLPKFLNAKIGHWIAVLSKVQLYDMNLYLIYDSSGTLPTAMKNVDAPAGITTVWADEFVFTDWLKLGGASNIISKM